MTATPSTPQQPTKVPLTAAERAALATIAEMLDTCKEREHKHVAATPARSKDADRAARRAEERRRNSKKLVDAIFFAMGASLEIEDALGGVKTGLMLSDGVNTETFGVLVALRAMLARPDALQRAIRGYGNDSRQNGPYWRAACTPLYVQRLPDRFGVSDAPVTVMSRLPPRCHMR